MSEINVNKCKLYKSTFNTIDLSHFQSKVWGSPSELDCIVEGINILLHQWPDVLNITKDWRLYPRVVPTKKTSKH
jgi:hypothetical protein